MEKQEFVKSLKEIDYLVLKDIYRYRYLSREQVYLFYYGKVDRTEGYSLKRIRAFLKHGFLLEKKVDGISTLRISNQGIKLLAAKADLRDIPEAKTGQGKSTVLGLYTAKDLELSEKLIKHQLSLSGFALEIEKNYFSAKYTFYNDKYLYSIYPKSRYDGLLASDSEVIGLEMDMGTESSKSFIPKWGCFKDLFESKEYLNDNRKKSVMFILNNPLHINRRRRTILKSIFDNIWHLIGGSTEIYIDSAEHLLDNIAGPEIDLKKIFPKIEEGYREVGSTEFTFLGMAELTPFDLLIDSYIEKPISVYKKIDEFIRLKEKHKREKGKELRYLIITEEKDVEILKEDLKVLGIQIEAISGILFTSLQRLHTKPFNEAVWRFSIDGSRQHFVNADFSGCIPE